MGLVEGFLGVYGCVFYGGIFTGFFILMHFSSIVSILVFLLVSVFIVILLFFLLASIRLSCGVFRIFSRHSFRLWLHSRVRIVFSLKIIVFSPVIVRFLLYVPSSIRGCLGVFTPDM